MILEKNSYMVSVITDIESSQKKLIMRNEHLENSDKNFDSQRAQTVKFESQCREANLQKNEFIEKKEELKKKYVTLEVNFKNMTGVCNSQERDIGGLKGLLSKLLGIDYWQEGLDIESLEGLDLNMSYFELKQACDCLQEDLDKEAQTTAN